MAGGRGGTELRDKKLKLILRSLPHYRVDDEKDINKGKFGGNHSNDNINNGYLLPNISHVLSIYTLYPSSYFTIKLAL